MCKDLEWFHVSIDSYAALLTGRSSKNCLQKTAKVLDGSCDCRPFYITLYCITSIFFYLGEIDAKIRLINDSEWPNFFSHIFSSLY